MSVVVPQYYARLGNNLFQYVWPRICSHELGYEFSAPPLLNLETNIPGLHYDSPIQNVTDFEEPDAHTGVPIEEVLGRRDPRKIIMWGFYQQANKYSQYRDLIKSWFRSSLTPMVHDLGTLGISIRIDGDYAGLGWVLPESYYNAAMAQAANLNPKHCIVYADVPYNRLGNHIAIIYRYCTSVEIVSHLKPIDQLRSMMGCSNLIGCNSTFSWWGTFLSNSGSVWMPHNWQPWGVGRDGDRTWPVGHNYPTDLRHHEKGWHILYGPRFTEME